MIGQQDPDIRWLPRDQVTNAAPEVIEFADSFGLELDPWQKGVITDASWERSDGLWSASTVGVEVPRQNGKGAILEARELAGLFVFEEKLIVHSAHLFKTSRDAFKRVRNHIENTPELRKKCKKPRGSKMVGRDAHGNEGIELIKRSGEITREGEIRFVARGGGSGRGFTGDLVILDEAMILDPESIDDMVPSLAARPNPQTWMVGSSPLATSLIWYGIRKAAIQGTDPRMAYSGWGIDINIPEDITAAQLLDIANNRDHWARVNPGLGYRLSEEKIEGELGLFRSAGNLRGFIRERLGVPDRPTGEITPPIAVSDWHKCGDAESQIESRLTFVVDTDPDMKTVYVCAVGLNAEGLPHLELVEQFEGSGRKVGWDEDADDDEEPETDEDEEPEEPEEPEEDEEDEANLMLEEWLKARVKTHKPAAVAVDKNGPIMTMRREWGRLGCPIEEVTLPEQADGWGMIVKGAQEHRLAHLHQAEVSNCLLVAVTKPNGDRSLLSRTKSTGSVSPLVAFSIGIAVVNRERKPVFAFA